MKSKVWLALMAVYIVWGSTYLAIRFTVESVPPFLSAGVRFLISGTILYVWRRLSGDPHPTRVEWRSAFIIGTLLLLGGNGSLVWAEQIIPSGIAALFIGATPLWMVLIDTLLPKGYRANWLTWLGVIIGFTGIVYLVGPQKGGGGSGLNLVGVAVLLFAALSWSIGSLYSRRARLPESPLMYTGIEMLAGSLGLFAAATVTGEWSQLNIAAITPRSLLGLGYLITFGSLVGFVSYTWLLRNAPTPLVATYAYVNPVVALVLGTLLAQESLSPRVVISAMVIIGSVVLINFAKSIPPKERPEILPQLKESPSSRADG